MLDKFLLMKKDYGPIGTMVVTENSKMVTLKEGLDGWFDKPAEWYYQYQAGQRVFKDREVDEFINNQVTPSNRQNICDFLEAAGLKEYDAYEFIKINMGHHANSPFYLEWDKS